MHTQIKPIKPPAELADILPEHCFVSLVLERYIAKHVRWKESQWRAISVLVNDQVRERGAPTLIHRSDGGCRYVYPGFKVTLYADELEGYLQNLQSNNPCIFIVCQELDDNNLEPMKVSLAYGEAERWTEVEAHVLSLPMLPQIYRWVESFVVRYYVPEASRIDKRKRKQWFDAAAASPSHK